MDSVLRVAPHAVDEQIVAIVPGTSENERLVFATRRSVDGKPIQLRRESFSSDVGWFVQSTLEMTCEEMRFLRSAFGGQVSDSRARSSSNERPPHEEPPILSLADFSRSVSA